MSKIAVHTTLTIALSGLLATPAYAATIDINVELPKLNVAEYHRPYVAVWIEGADTAPSGCPICASGGASPAAR